MLALHHDGVTGFDGHKKDGFFAAVIDLAADIRCITNNFSNYTTPLIVIKQKNQIQVIISITLYRDAEFDRSF